MLSTTETISDLSGTALLEWAANKYGTRFAVLTSFQAEGMVVLDMALRISPDIRVLTLDTGRLPAETYDMIETVRQRYQVPVELVFPDAQETEQMTTRFGPNLFRDSVAERRLCCEIRKVRPLSRKLEGIDAWAVGLRREQSELRESVETITEENGRFKLSPLADWTREQIQEYTREHNLPVHPLYKQGYTSIGCGPCTRATRPGEAERAGRWWWEEEGNAECGLHFTAEGKVERSVDVLLREILSID